MKKYVYRIITVSLVLSIIFCALTGCKQDKGADKIPAVLILERSDSSNLYSPGEIDKDTVIRSLGFYDRDGNYYFSDSSDVNALNNKTLAEEYESGHLTEKLKSEKSLDADSLLKDYKELRRVCLNENTEMDYPESLPAVEAVSTTWYAFYYDTDGNLQYTTIHANTCMTDIYSKSDKINEIYKRIIK